MNSMIHIGSTDKHATAKSTAEAIVKIFKGGKENAVDQSVLSEALRTFGAVAEVKNVTVQNSTFTNNPKPEGVIAPPVAPEQPNEDMDDEDEDLDD